MVVVADGPGTGLHDRLALLYANDWGEEMREILLAPSGFGTEHTLQDAVEMLPTAVRRQLLPLALVDESSIAVVGMSEDLTGINVGHVYRLHLNDVPDEFQLNLLDIDPLIYAISVEEELRARSAGLVRVLDQIGPAYEDSHLAREKRPRDYVIRPVRIACQNVIVGLGAIAQDSTFDGLSVPAWQTCEVPHVATHEANRALAALTLCDAFQNGGTMEIRFDRDARVVVNGRRERFQGHPENQVPASLRRFGRTVRVTLGAEDPAAITPMEARDLFLAITPMPTKLRARVEVAVSDQGITPERVCFLLLSQVWREIEMDLLLATSGRAPSILSGGADWTDRASRQAESEVCRAAVIVGMFYRRLNSTDAAVDDISGVRVVEDRKKGVRWSVHPDESAVTFTGLDPKSPVPWAFGLTGVETLTVFPRTSVRDETVAAVAAAEVPGHKALLIPTDMAAPVDCPVAVLRCPDRLADIDKAIEDRLLKSRISRG